MAGNVVQGEQWMRTAGRLNATSVGTALTIWLQNGMPQLPQSAAWSRNKLFVACRECNDRRFSHNPRISFIFLRISTQTVDNIVDKPFPAPRKPRIHAVFLKMPVLNAKIKRSEINHLAAMQIFPTSLYEAYSYNILQWGISPQKVGFRKLFMHPELL